MIRLDFSIELEYQVLQTADFIFNIHAVNTTQQRVSMEQLTILPRISYDIELCRTFGNRYLRLRAEPGPLNVRYTAMADINHRFDWPNLVSEMPLAKIPVDVLEYLYPSRYCPSDRLSNAAMQQFGAMSPGYDRVQAIGEWVRNRTRFQAGSTNFRTCAFDTFNERVGVCRDFAHLMIAMCRALNIPARFVSGLDYGADPALGPPDFHAYVEVYLSGRWYIFDPTGICPTTGLVRIGTGRDASDVSFATIFGNVMSSAPRINVVAHENPAAGIELPMPSTHAVCTSDTAVIGHSFGPTVPPDRLVPTPRPALEPFTLHANQNSMAAAGAGATTS